MKKFKNTLSLLVISALNVMTLQAKGTGTSGGLTLLEPSGARAAAMGEAFTAVNNDISAFSYNPANLKTLESGQASFLYEKGLVEDSYGQFQIGTPYKNSGLGLSVGYYNGGAIELFDGSTTKSVTAQKDLNIAMGYAMNLGGLSVGFTGKYLSSELVETYKATAYAMDMGLSLPVSSKIRMGAAVQNIGTQMKFVSEGDNLPRIARMGMSMNMFGKSMLSLDAPYYLNEAELRPAVGLETMVGPLAIRAGYKHGTTSEFTIGSGFALGRSNLDYSFGMLANNEAQHKVSMSMKFGNGGVKNSAEFVKKQNVPELAKKVEKKSRKVEETASMSTATGKPLVTFVQKRTLGGASNKNRVYIVQSGDTLAKIAKNHYGDSRQWKTIQTANSHLIPNGSTIETGMRIVLP